MIDVPLDVRKQQVLCAAWSKTVRQYDVLHVLGTRKALYDHQVTGCKFGPILAKLLSRSIDVV